MRETLFVNRDTLPIVSNSARDQKPVIARYLMNRCTVHTAHDWEAPVMTLLPTKSFNLYSVIANYLHVCSCKHDVLFTRQSRSASLPV